MTSYFGVEDDELQSVIDAIGEAPMTFDNLLPHLTNDEESYPELRINSSDTSIVDVDYSCEDDGFLERIGAQIARDVAHEARTQGRRRGV